MTKEIPNLSYTKGASPNSAGAPSSRFEMFSHTRQKNLNDFAIFVNPKSK